MNDSPRERPLLIVWLILGVLVALIVGDGPHEPMFLPLAVGAWSAIATLGIRSSKLLLAAREGRMKTGTGAQPWRLWRRAWWALLMGLLPGFFGTRLAFSFVEGYPRRLLMALLVLAVPAGYLVVKARFPRDVEFAWSARKTSLFAWAVLDTGLPAAFVAATFGIAALWLKHGHRAELPPSELARHLAVSLVIYGTCLGMAGFVKTRSERLGDLVEAPIMETPSPGPVAVAGIAAVAMLALGPRLLPTMSFADALVMKSVFGFLCGGALSTLGALKGARDPEAADGPSRWGRPKR